MFATLEFEEKRVDRIEEQEDNVTYIYLKNVILWSGT